KYNKRVDQALNALKDDSITCTIVGEGRSDGECSVVLLENGKYLGYGFCNHNLTGKPDKFSAPSFNNLKETIMLQRDNREVQAIIRSYLRTRKDYKIHLPS
ncbi:MAG: hypothetical protein ABIQ74_04975, partial [Chitinophagales bacterium]